MQVAQTFKSANFADLEIAPSALYLLAAPSTPEEARDLAIERASSGSRITHKLAIELISQVKKEKARSRKPVSFSGIEPDIHQQQNWIETQATPEEPVANFEEVLPPLHVYTSELIIGLVSNLELLSDEQLSYTLDRIIAEQHRRRLNTSSSNLIDSSHSTVEQLDPDTGSINQPLQLEPTTPPNVKSLIEFFDKAAQHIQKPSVQIVLQGHTLCVARNSTRYPGALNLNDWEGNWHGRINSDGSLFQAYSWQPWVMPMLEEFAANPAASASRMGKATGCCCFCNKQLSDPQSVATGYGAKCAQHFGLPYPLVVEGEGEILPVAGTEIEIISHRHGSEYVGKKGTVLSTSMAGCLIKIGEKKFFYCYDELALEDNPKKLALSFST